MAEVKRNAAIETTSPLWILKSADAFFSFTFTSPFLMRGKIPPFMPLASKILESTLSSLRPLSSVPAVKVLKSIVASIKVKPLKFNLVLIYIEKSTQIMYNTPMDFKSQLSAFFSQPALLACIFSWLSAQFLKTLIKLFSGKVHSLKELLELLLWRTGSMPSSHAALVTTLCTTIGFHSGVDSDVFILSLGFFLVTVRDAVGVRRANGLQAALLNKLGRVLSEKGIIEFKAIKEVQGHTPAEVIMGILLGFVIGYAFCVLK